MADPDFEIERWEVKEGNHRQLGLATNDPRLPIRINFSINATRTWMRRLYTWMRSERREAFFPPFVMPEAKMRPVTFEIDNLARRALALELNDWPWPAPEDVEEVRSILAEWLEEGGDLAFARLLRPWKPFPDQPSDVRWAESEHTRGRRWVLNAIREAYEKRDAIADLERRNAAL